MTDHTCIWPKCYNRPWVSRGLPICLEHAMTVAHVMTPEPATRTATEARIRSLEAVVRDQAATITMLRRPPAPPKKRAVDGTIYYVQVGAHVKIGWTSNMGSRMRTYPPNSQLLATHPGTRSDEAHLHRRFAADRTHGREWYVPSVSLTHHIEQVVAQHGQPEHVVFGAKPLTVPRIKTSQPIGARSTRLAGAI